MLDLVLNNLPAEVVMQGPGSLVDLKHQLGAFQEVVVLLDGKPAWGVHHLDEADDPLQLRRGVEGPGVDDAEPGGSCQPSCLAGWARPAAGNIVREIPTGDGKDILQQQLLVSGEVFHNLFIRSLQGRPYPVEGNWSLQVDVLIEFAAFWSGPLVA